MQPRAAFACALLWGAVCATGAARAERRPVAVVNLDPGTDPVALELIGRINAALEQNPRLARVPNSHDEDALHDPIASEDQAALDAGRAALATARADLDRYDVAAAARSAQAGLRPLTSVAPAAAAGPYAELTFTLGVALLGQGAAAAASAELSLVHRLAPTMSLGPEQLPEVVAAFRKAGAASAGAGAATLVVHGTGRVWVDGVEIGDAPRELTVAAGPHLVQLAGPERQPRGERIELAAQGTRTVAIEDAPLPRELQIYRARTAIVTAADSMARSAAIRRLAQLIGVSDVVLVDVVPGATGAAHLTEQTWQEAAGFSAIHAPTAAPGELLDVLAPPPPDIPIEPPPFVRPPRPVVPPPPPLYARRWFQGSVAAAVVTAIVYGVVRARQEGTVTPNPNLGGMPPVDGKQHW